MTKVAVVLSGCGVKDGSEIHEAVSGLIALAQNGASYECLAPDIPQPQVVNHVTGKPEGEPRNVMVEAARIARGEIKPLGEASAKDYDAIFFPGGFGAARNLCNFAEKGKDCDVNTDVARFVREAHEAEVPLAFMCISPVIAAKVLGQSRPTLTVGSTSDVSAALEAMGARHEAVPVTEAVVDEANRIVSCPAYMYGEAPIDEVFEGISKAVHELLNLTARKQRAQTAG